MNSEKNITPARVNPVLVHPDENRINLDGKWDFCLDPENKGVKKKWFAKPDSLIKKIAVPGCWQGQGFGGDGKDFVWDFRLEARTFRATYKGTGWYGRHCRLPADWAGKRICLNFGGAHPSAEVWLNGTRLGENHAPFVPFGFDITQAVRAGRENFLAVRVHEQDRFMGMCFNFQGNWSGLYRGVELTATASSFLQVVKIHPDADRQAARFRIEVGGDINGFQCCHSREGGNPVRRGGNIPGFPIKSGMTKGAQHNETDTMRLHLEISIRPMDGNQPPIRSEIEVVSPAVDHEIDVPSPRLWSPDSPNLYRVDVALMRGAETLDAVSERVGFVKLSTEGHRFLINGEPYYMRGSGDFLSHPETGCPDTDRERWRRKLKALRAYGYNYVRCQSYVPSPEYFDVADEVGLLVQSEMGMLGAWGGTTPWHTYGWPPPRPSHREALRQQWNNVVLRDVNHPSANLYCMSNELQSRTDYPRTAWQCYRETKAIKPTAFVIWTDGGHSDELPGDFINVFAAGPSGQVSDQLKKYESSGKPIIQHEFAWWSSFPDVRISRKYSGAIRHYAADIAREAARTQDLERLLPEFAEKSQHLQFIEAKAKMENCRRDIPRLAGICHFNAMDANPSPQGIIDEFYERKLVDAATWLQTNGDTVIMANLGFDDRVLEAGSEFKCKFFVSDFAHPVFKTSALGWRLTAGKKELASGSLACKHKAYCTHPVGEIRIAVPAVSRPIAARLEAMLHDGNRRVTNAWNVWLFPRGNKLLKNAARYGNPEHTWLKGWNDLPSVNARELTAGMGRVMLAEQLDEPLLDFMRAGGRVVLAAGEGLVRPHGPLFGYVKYFFTPPANYAPYEDGQNGTIIRNHPMLGDFPQEGFADFQFFRMMEEAPPIEIKPLGLAEGDPVIRVIHRYPVCHPLAYLLERGLGKGGIILTSLRLSPAFPEARRLLANICSYAAGAGFKPKLKLSDEAAAHIMKGTRFNE